MRIGRVKRPSPAERPRRSSWGVSETRQPTFSYYAGRTTAGPGGAGQRRESSRRDSGRQVGRRRFRRAPYWFALIVGLVCAGKVLYVSSTPKLVLVDRTSASVAYERPLSVYTAAAAAALKSSPANHFKLTVDTSGIAAQLLQQFPELQHVSVALPLIGNRPIVYVSPTEPSLVLQTVKGNFAISQGGTVLAQLPSLPAGSLVVQDQSGVQVQPSRRVLPAATVTFVQTVAHQLRAAKLSPTTFILPPTSTYELDVRLAAKPYIVRLNLQADALEQSGAVVAVIDQLGGTVPSQYIDARVPGRIYYK